MRFSKETIEGFDSIYSVAAYTSMLVAGKRMLEFAGGDIVHMFVYEKFAHMVSVPVNGNVVGLKSRYARLPHAETEGLPTFNKEEEVLVVVVCLETKIKHSIVVPLAELYTIAGLGTPTRTVVFSCNTLHKACNTCQKDSCALQTCSACKSAMYCSIVCQKADWEVHKPSCIEVQKANS